MKKIIFLAIVIITLFAFKSSDSIIVKGKVTNEAGIPLAGVIVMTKRSKIGVQTDSAGSFSINVPNTKEILVFTYTGYQRKEIKVGNERMITIILEPAIIDTNQVMIID